MSLEEIRLGRQSYTGGTVVTCQTTATNLLGADDNRRTIVVSAPSANRLTISDQNSVTDQNGIVIYGGGPPYTMTLETHGDIVTGQLFGVMQTLSASIGVTYATLDPEFRI